MSLIVGPVLLSSSSSWQKGADISYLSTLQDMYVYVVAICLAFYTKKSRDIRMGPKIENF